MVFTFLIVCLVGTVSLVVAWDATIGFSQESLFDSPPPLAKWAGLLVLCAFGLMSTTILGWYLFRLLAWLYESRKSSDQSLLIDFTCFLYAVSVCPVFVAADPRYLVMSLIAFISYAASLVAVRRLTRGWFRPPKAPPRLLELRVFSLENETAHLFDWLGRYWRQIGPMTLIAGDDLA
jgi:hypothetical protein